MTRAEGITITLRLFALLLLVLVLLLLVMSVVTASGVRDWTIAGMGLAQSALMLGAGALIWRSSAAIAGFVSPAEEEGAPGTPVTREGLQHVAFRAVGLVLAAMGLSGLAQCTVFAELQARAYGGGSWLRRLGQPDLGAGIAQSLVQLVAGVFLFLGAEGIRRIKDRVRGVEPGEPSEPTTDGA